jgi:hypothetical protein
MKKGFLRGRIAGNELAAGVEFREPRRIETTE